MKDESLHNFLAKVDVKWSKVTLAKVDVGETCPTPLSNGAVL